LIVERPKAETLGYPEESANASATAAATATATATAKTKYGDLSTALLTKGREQLRSR
jgi:hypothetical protein